MKNNSLPIVAFVFITSLLGMNAVFASTDTLFTVGVNQMTTILTGTGGILITLVAILSAVVLGATGNIRTALAALGVAIIASIGPSVATSFFNAIL